MHYKYYFWTALAGIHLLLATLSAAHFSQWNHWPRPVNNALHQLGEFTGSSHLYSFFAPFVGEQVSVLYTLVDSTGQQQPWMMQGKTHESHTRITTSYNFLNLAEGEPIFCQSFGNNALRLHPTARWVRVCVVQQTMPSLTMARDSGVVPRWQPLLIHDYQRTQP